MDDLGFHRKYRPKTLGEYIGNERLKKSIRKALEAEKKPQVILLSGPAGTGKTTMARLISKEYLCLDPQKDVGACNVCYNCTAMDEFIETGRSDILTNIREVDVTDSNKKQDIDELLEDASQPSFDGNWKIYILDECHMMTNSAQNRLLKTLEEPPDKVLMILCTTNPEKLLDTIVSRCQVKQSVTKPTRLELTELLKRVCKAEQLLYDSRSLSLICAKADFVPRKALIELENVAREAKEVTYEKTVEILNIIADKFYFEFFDILLEEPINTQRYIAFLGKIKMNMELVAFMDSLIPFILRGIYSANAVVVESLDASEITQYKKLFKQFNVEDLAYLLETLVSIKENSRDIEAKLMLLGYKGVRKPIFAPIDQNMYLDNTKQSTADEKKAGIIELQKMKEEKAKEQEKKFEDFKKSMGYEDIASVFGGIVVE